MAEVFNRYVGDDAFAARFSKTAIIADQSFASALARTPAGRSLTTIAKGAALLRPWTGRDREVLLCLSEGDEDFERAIGRIARCPVFNVWRDWVLPRAARYDGSADRPTTAATKTRYSILTQPRTGSTFLCHELQKAGLGMPREHLRPYVASAMARRLIAIADFERWWSVLSATTAARGIVGTKLIYGFLESFLAACKSDAGRATRLVFGESVIRIRRNLVDVAVSDVVAHQARTWHLWYGHTHSTYSAALAKVSLDDETLLAQHTKFVADETAMDALLADFRGEILEVHFERFTREPGKAVADIARFLQTTSEPTCALWQQPESWNTHSAVHQSAAGRLRALLGESPARYATSP